MKYGYSKQLSEMFRLFQEDILSDIESIVTKFLKILSLIHPCQRNGRGNQGNGRDSHENGRCCFRNRRGI